MQLNNVKKKVEKAATKIGIAADETILAACTTNPSGTMTRMVAKELGGVLGALAADRNRDDSGGGADSGGLAERFPTGQHYLVVTDKRLLAFSVATMSGKPKDLKAEWTTDEVLGISTEQAKLGVPMSIGFADGSGVRVEAARGTGAETLPAAFGTEAVRTSGPVAD